MTSENQSAPGDSYVPIEAVRTRLRVATAASYAAKRSLLRERELQREHTQELLASTRQHANHITDALQRAERLADATMHPLRIWEEASMVAGLESSSATPEADSRLMWVLEEAASICDMFLRESSDGEGANAGIMSRIDAVLAALDAEER